MAEAVRFGKQRNRNVAKRRDEGRGESRRQQLRREADNHLLATFDEQQDARSVLDTDDMDEVDDE